MKKIIFAILMLISFSAFAGMWFLVHSEYSPGTGWLCTYKLQGGNYEQTIVSNNVCPYTLSN